MRQTVEARDVSKFVEQHGAAALLVPRFRDRRNDDCGATCADGERHVALATLQKNDRTRNTDRLLAFGEHTQPRPIVDRYGRADEPANLSSFNKPERDEAEESGSLERPCDHRVIQ